MYKSVLHGELSQCRTENAPSEFPSSIAMNSFKISGFAFMEVWLCKYLSDEGLS